MGCALCTGSAVAEVESVGNGIVTLNTLEQMDVHMRSTKKYKIVVFELSSSGPSRVVISAGRNNNSYPGGRNRQKLAETG